MLMSRFLVAVLLLLCPAACLSDSADQEAAERYLEQYNVMAEAEIYADTLASWEYNTNINDETQQASVAADLKYSQFVKAVSENASTFDTDSFTNDTLKRLFDDLTDVGTNSLDAPKQKQLADDLSSMEATYSQATVNIPGKGDLNLEPGLTRLMAESTKPDELLQAWRGWRDASGKKMRKTYQDFVALSNEAVKKAGYADTGDYWKSSYESPTFEDDILKLYDQLKPLYTNLHIYVRRKLKEMYKTVDFPSSGHIPAHLLGNMWAQSWGNLLSRVQPFDRESVDVTPAMLAQNYTAKRMFKLSQEFFLSLGLLPMTEEFWNNSMIVRPDDGRDVVCHASAWDFYNRKDFRIKMCTDITMSDLVTIHHEMGHIQYYQQYKDQPVPFRGGANPGFHEAIGDVMALSVSTPKHLEEIGLLQNATNDDESVINFLMSMALDKIAFMPFGYLIDQWRWSVFRGDTPPSQYNTKWWELRCKYQGISPPVQRSENDFDPGAKYHIPANTPYIRYFVSTVIQFQFHKALCDAAGHTGPLYACDIFRSEEAGDLLSGMLRMGSSKPWQDAMAAMTGQRNMDAGPLLEYFEELSMFLTTANAEAGDTTGWEDACPSHGLASRLLTPGYLLVLGLAFWSAWYRDDSTASC